MVERVVGDQEEQRHAALQREIDRLRVQSTRAPIWNRQQQLLVRLKPVDGSTPFPQIGGDRNPPRVSSR